MVNHNNRHPFLLQFLRTVLLLLFVLHYSNMTMFYHVHRVGSVVYGHSHFSFLSDDQAIPVSPHSEAERLLIDTLNHFVLTNGLQLPAVQPPEYFLTAIFLAEAYSSPVFDTEHSLRLRGPPAHIA